MTALQRHPSMVFIIAIIKLSYTWIYFFQNSPFIRGVGIFTFQMIGLLVSIIWVFKTYYTLKKEKDKECNFWLLLGLGMLLYGIAWLNWAYYYLLLRTTPPYPGFADYIWILAYLIWIIALTYKLGLVLKKSEINRYLFDISIFMIIVTAIFWELLFSDIIFNLSGNFLTDAINSTKP